MKTRLFAQFACATLLAVALNRPAPAQAPAARPPAGPPPPMQIKEVKAGVYMITGNGGNSTLRVGKKGAILVDTKNPGNAIFVELMKKIESVTQLPVDYVFITHLHNDHAGNTVHFLPDVKVVGAAEMPDLISRYTPPGNASKPALPNVTYHKSYSASIPGAKVLAYHFAPAHTGGDTVVLFPDVRVVATGDEVVSASPNVDYPFGGSVLGWQKAMQGLLKLKFDIAIPGHGDNPMTRAEVEAYAKKWNTFIDRARAQIKAGTPKDQLMAKIKTDDLGWNVTTAQWTAPARLDPFYAELSKK